MMFHIIFSLFHDGSRVGSIGWFNLNEVRSQKALPVKKFNLKSLSFFLAVFSLLASTYLRLKFGIVVLWVLLRFL